MQNHHDIALAIEITETIKKTINRTPDLTEGEVLLALMMVMHDVIGRLS
jgi:hypothetical protein